MSDLDEEFPLIASLGDPEESAPAATQPEQEESWFARVFGSDEHVTSPDEAYDNVLSRYFNDSASLGQITPEEAMRIRQDPQATATADAIADNNVTFRDSNEKQELQRAGAQLRSLGFGD